MHPQRAPLGKQDGHLGLRPISQHEQRNANDGPRKGAFSSSENARERTRQKPAEARDGPRTTAPPVCSRTKRAARIGQPEASRKIDFAATRATPARFWITPGYQTHARPFCSSTTTPAPPRRFPRRKKYVGIV